MTTTLTEAHAAAKKIMAALEAPEWDWRTVDGISRETGISREEIRGFLNQSGGTVVKSVARDRQGRALFTTRKRYRERPLLERLRDHYSSTAT